MNIKYENNKYSVGSMAEEDCGEAEGEEIEKLTDYYCDNDEPETLTQWQYWEIRREKRLVMTIIIIGNV